MIVNMFNGLLLSTQVVWFCVLVLAVYGWCKALRVDRRMRNLVLPMLLPLVVSLLMLAPVGESSIRLSLVLLVGLFLLVLLRSLPLDGFLRHAAIAAKKPLAPDRRQWLDHLVESAYEGIYLVDPEALVYVEVNPSGAEALQFSPEEMRGMSLHQVHHEKTDQVATALRAAVREQRRQTLVVDAVRRDALKITVEITLSPVLQEGRMLVLAVGRDISRSVRHRQQVDFLSRMLWMIGSINRAISRERNEETLFQRICDIAIESGQFSLAWIGEVREGGMYPVCSAGEGGDYLRKAHYQLDESLLQNTPLAQAVRSASVVVENCISESDALSPWRNKLLERSLNSLAAVPLLNDDGGVIAVLLLYSRERDLFSEQLVDILRNLSGDVSWAVRSYGAQRARLVADQRIRLLSRVLEQSADAVSMLDLEGGIRYVNPRYSVLTGYVESEIIGKSPRLLCFDEEEAGRFDKVFADLRQGRQWRGEFRRRKKSGEEYWSMETISPIRDAHGCIVQYVSTAEDFTALKKAQSKIEQLAFFDPLTGLPNRRLMHDRMRSHISVAERQHKQLAVMWLDIDRFKTVNDAQGHQQGDALLKIMAQRLELAAGPDATVSRPGGDEFVVILGNLDQHRDVAFVAERMLAAIRQPLDLGGVRFQTTASMGIALYPLDGIDMHELIRCADMAMYHAKSLGRDNFQFFTADINAAALAQVALEQRLRDAIRDGCLEPYYQPIWDSTGQVLGFEALVRWRDPDEGLILPSIFIPLAEEVGLVEAIGELVLRKACHDMVQVRKSMGCDYFISVNLSAAQFGRPDRLIAVLDEALESSGLPASKLELELTESMLVNDVDEALLLMAQVRRLGIRLVIDDFGTGYSSLNYLSSFPVDKLKIDRSFVVDIEGKRGRAIASAIIALGNRLGMKVVAEGVETDQQRQILRSQGCDQFQGFLVSRALPIEDVVHFLKTASSME